MDHATVVVEAIVIVSAGRVLHCACLFRVHVIVKRSISQGKKIMTL
jgi:hypothetical protein